MKRRQAGSGRSVELPELEDPPPARCDVCGHHHVCYVGGRLRVLDATLAVWERHICLGCLVRTLDPAGFESCSECREPA